MLPLSREPGRGMRKEPKVGAQPDPLVAPDGAYRSPRRRAWIKA